MIESKQATDFPDLSVEDTVSLTLTAGGDPAAVEFSLESSNSITWWKAVEVFGARGALLGRVQTQDANHGPLSMSVAVTDLVGARLVLAKAKLFGIHTPMYEVRNISFFAGRRLEFLWQRDDHRAGPVAGFFRDLGNGVMDAAEAVAGVVESVIETVGEIVDTVVQTVGNIVADVIDAVGGVLGEIPGIGPILRGAVHWVATIVSAAFDLVGSIVKGVLDLVSGLIAGVVRVVGGAVGGLLASDGRQLVEGLGDIAAGIAGPVVVILGKAVALVQSVLFMQLGQRQLSAAERALLVRVFRGSVFFYNVRVVDGFAGLFSTNPRPFTLGNTIYMKNQPAGDYLRTLVHECTHVWQNQHHGSRYVADALWAQATIADHYNWKAEIAAGRFLWHMFNAEAQAKFVDDVYDAGRRIPATNVKGEFFDDDPLGVNLSFLSSGQDFTALAQDSVTYIRDVWWFVSKH